MKLSSNTEEVSFSNNAANHFLFFFFARKLLFIVYDDSRAVVRMDTSLMVFFDMLTSGCYSQR